MPRVFLNAPAIYIRISSQYDYLGTAFVRESGIA